MLPGKSKPKIRKLSRGHHSAFIHQHPAPSTQPPSIVHPSSIHLLIRSSIYPAIQCPFIHLSLRIISIHYTVSVRPSSHPSIHQSYPFNIYSFLYLPIQCPSNHPLVPQSMHLFKHLSFPSIHSFKVQIHPSIHPLFIYPSIHHSSTQIMSVYPKCSLLAFTLIPESPVELFHPGERGGGCPGDFDTSTLLPKNHSILESFLGFRD